MTQWHGGKGSTQRPKSIADEEYAQRWDAIFGKDQPENKEQPTQEDNYVYVCFECNLTPYEGAETVLAIFDNDKDAKEYATEMEKMYGSEYFSYSYEKIPLNKKRWYGDDS